MAESWVGIQTHFTPSSHFTPFTRLPFLFLSQHPASVDVQEVDWLMCTYEFSFIYIRCRPQLPFSISTLSLSSRQTQNITDPSAFSTVRNNDHLNFLGSSLSFPLSLRPKHLTKAPLALRSPIALAGLRLQV